MAELDEATRRRVRLLSKPKRWRNEDEFRKHVTAFAECLGYRVNFTYRAKTRDGSWRTNATAPGFPDLCCSKRGRLVFLELKMPYKVPTLAQEEWVARLQTVPGVDAFVVYPADWPDVVALLLDDEPDDDDPFEL
jgi:hypothetical protein